MAAVNVAVEGSTDRAVIARVLSVAGLDLGTVYGQKGKAHLDSCLKGFNHSAKYRPWIVVRDLDQDAACAADLVATLLPEPATWMRLRIAARAIESWLLADAESLASFLSIEMTKVPSEPDALPDPKAVLIGLARKSRRRTLVDELVPRAGSSRQVGPGYAARMAEFASSRWRPLVARTHSDSLARCIDRVAELSLFQV